MKIEDEWLLWNDGCVAKMAVAILDDMDYNLCPVLADALEDAGCDNIETLKVLRSPCVGNIHASKHFDILLGIRIAAEQLAPYHAWYSEKMIRVSGYANYKQDGKIICVTEIRKIDVPWNGWDDNVYLGTVRMKDMLSRVEAPFPFNMEPQFS